MTESYVSISRHVILLEDVAGNVSVQLLVSLFSGLRGRYI